MKNKSAKLSLDAVSSQALFDLAKSDLKACITICVLDKQAENQFTVCQGFGMSENWWDSLSKQSRYEVGLLLLELLKDHQNKIETLLSATI
jgi:hypothetical protein